MLLSRPPRSRALAPFVASLWLFRGELAHRLERVLPNGRMQLVVNLFEDELRDYTSDGVLRHVTSGAALKGAQTRAFVIDTLAQRDVCGVSFVPGGAAAFFPMPAAEIGEQAVALDQLWGRAGQRVRERVLEATVPAAQLDVLEAELLEHLQPGVPRDGSFQHACTMLAAGASVAAVERSLGLSPRVFIARFRGRSGLTPSRFARIARFQRLLDETNGTLPWAQLAARHGYADQAHMIRDFKELAGVTPTGYRARSPDARNHVAVQPA